MKINFVFGFVFIISCFFTLYGMMEEYTPLIRQINSEDTMPVQEIDFVRYLETGEKTILKLNNLGISDAYFRYMYPRLLEFINEKGIEELQLEENKFHDLLGLLDLLHMLLKDSPSLMIISLKKNFICEPNAVRTHAGSVAIDILAKSNLGGQVQNVFEKAVEAAKQKTDSTVVQKFIIFDEPHTPIMVLSDKLVPLTGCQRFKKFAFTLGCGLAVLAVTTGEAVLVLYLQSKFGK